MFPISNQENELLIYIKKNLSITIAGDFLRSDI